MVSHPNCPDPVKLAEYATGESTAAPSPLLDRHLSECRLCLDRFLELGRRSIAPEIPDCHVVREVGRGRFGVVYKAWWTKGPPRLVALKVLSSPNAMERHRFEREIGVLKRLDSPAIVKCLESGATGDGMYFVMDFVEGVHLDDHLATGGLDLTGKLAVLRRVCLAVAEAHANGVVHRDLKPRNILIDDAGEPHILDFGICSVSRNEWSSWAQLTITHPGDVIGTLRYMSPEQAWGGAAGAIDERSDVWALGILLYEIVTDGAYPYSLDPMPDKPIHEALLERIRKELPRLPTLDSLPRGRDLEVLLERCLAWEAEHRLSSAAVLAGDLERYIAGRRIETRPLRIRHKVKRLLVGAAVRARWVFSLSLVALTMLAVTACLYGFRVGWGVTGAAYQGTADSSPMPHLLEDPRAAMIIVGISEDTIPAVGTYAADNGIAGVTSDVRTWRSVHGRWMERLAIARPRALIWDYYFATERPGDDELVVGAKALESAGTPVVFAANGFHADGSPRLSSRIVEQLGEKLRAGAIVARGMVDRPGEFVMSVRNESGAVVPGVALTTLAALLHPEAQLEVAWTNRDRAVELLYRVGPGAYKRERDRVEVTTVFRQSLADPAVRSGDLVASTTLPIERPERWEKRTVRYEWLLTANDEELRQRTGGRIVVVGDLRRGAPGFIADRHAVRFPEGVVDDVPGCFLLADSVAGLLGRRYTVAAFPPPPFTYALLLGAAALGCWLPTNVASRAGLGAPAARKRLWIGLCGAGGVGLTMLLGSERYALVHAGLVGVALSMPMAGSFWVEFTRNRHRIGDVTPHADGVCVLAADGTLTLPTQRQRWRRSAG